MITHLADENCKYLVRNSNESAMKRPERDMHPHVRLIKAVRYSKARVLFLGYGPDETPLISEIVQAKCNVWHTKEPINSFDGYDLVISYGYRYILKKKMLESTHAPIINLHLSYLPWNRGSHPNFWSFYDQTPSGVTIHLVDEGVDTGPIIYQRHVYFSKEENTYTATYIRLRREMDQLFRENMDAILSMDFVAIAQVGKGSSHSMAQLPLGFSGWDSVINDEIVRLKRLSSYQNNTK